MLLKLTCDLYNIVPCANCMNKNYFYVFTSLAIRKKNEDISMLTVNN